MLKRQLIKLSYIVLSVFLISIIFGIISKETTNAETVFKPLYKCGTDPCIPKKSDGSTDWTKVYNDVLKPNKLPLYIYIKNKAYEVNEEYLYKYHFVVYGSHGDISPNTGPKACSGFTYTECNTWRYIGFTLESAGATCMWTPSNCTGDKSKGTYIEYEDPNFPPDISSKSTYIQRSLFYAYPWTPSGQPAKKHNSYPLFPDPTKDISYMSGIGVTNADRIEGLGFAIDSFSRNNHGSASNNYDPIGNFGRGYFAEDLKGTCGVGSSYGSQIWSTSKTCPSGFKMVTNTGKKDGDNDIIWEGRNLSKFATVTTFRHDYSAGGFLMFTYASTDYCKMNVCYGSFAMMPKFDPFCTTCGIATPVPDFECKDNPDITIPTMRSGETFKMGVNFVNKLPKTVSDVPYTFQWYDGSTPIGSPSSYTYNIGGGGKLIPAYFNITAPSTTALRGTSGSLNLVVKLNPNNNSFKFDYDTFTDIFEANAQHTAANNCNYTVNIDNRGDASVALTEPTNRNTIDTVIDVPIKVTNNMDDKISFPCGASGTESCLNSSNRDFKVTIKEVKLDGTKINVSGFPKTYSLGSIDSGKTSPSDFNLSKFNIKLPMGSYELTVDIPYYNNEKKYTNNTDTIQFKVFPFIPDNTECKHFEVPYTTIKKGTMNITKMCAGYVPNFPSTRVEEGKGTFFFVSYNLFPMPVPAYEVTNEDDMGVYQTYKLPASEQSDKPGVTESFLYYPIDSTNPKRLKGPYAAGPHDFYHYLYRGRLMPQHVKFTFVITEPNGNELYQNGEKVSGEIHLDLDPRLCYDDKFLDLKPECKSYYFYLPKESTDSYNDITTLGNLPVDAKDRLHFNNPGLHHFNFFAEETQKYWYQWDQHYNPSNATDKTWKGGEWQGDAAKNYTSRPAINGGTENVGPVRTEKLSNDSKTWYVREDSKYAKDVYNQTSDSYYFWNQCFDKQDAFNKGFSGTVGNYGTYEVFSDGKVCTHNHNKDFHYWLYNWSDPKYYGNAFTNSP